MRSLLKLFLMLLFTSIGFSAQTEKPLVKTFPATNGESLLLNIDPGHIEVNTWTKNEVEIKVESKKDYEVEDLVAEKSGDRIKFFLEVEDSWNNNINVIVNAPSNFNFDLKTTGGHISINNPIAGRLKAETDGGHVSFENVKGEVNVNTSGGHISGENVEGNVKLHTKGGNISLENVKVGKSDINTYGGNISIGNVDSDISAKTHGGNISVGNVGGKANVFTYGGHISVEDVSGSASMETYGGHLNLEGASGNVKAKTSGGHISLENITGSIDASTNGGHVNAQLDPDDNSVSSLSTSGGHMNLDIPSSAKATIEVFVENDNIEFEDPKEILKSDFPAEKFDVNKEAGEINAVYKLNGGGAKIKLDCTGGNVKISKWNK